MKTEDLMLMAVAAVVVYVGVNAIDKARAAPKSSGAGGWIGGVFEPNLLDQQYAQGWGYGD